MTSSSSAAGGRVLRADARRNRDHILEVAQRFFTEHGVDGSLDAVAKQAGVGPGTLYRHFPTREALLAALLEAREEVLGQRLETIRSESADAAEALRGWLEALVDWAGAFDGLPEPLRAAMTAERSPLALTCEGYISTTDAFLSAAQREGSARGDVRGRDLFLAVLATSWARGAALADEQSPVAMVDLLATGWATPPP